MMRFAQHWYSKAVQQAESNKNVLVDMPPQHSWFLGTKNTTSAKLRLFCFPYAGGGASIYRNWSDFLPTEIAVYPIQLPGRENRLTEPAFTDLSDLIQEIGVVVQPYLDQPMALFGHSMGALICFELARYLRRMKLPEPLLLLISACKAPQLSGHLRSLHMLEESRLREELRRLKGTPEEVLQNTELMQLMLPTLRADMKLYETYSYYEEERLACPISVFGGLGDLMVHRTDLLAWREQTIGLFKLHMLEGSHFFIHTARSVLLQAIADDMTQKF